MQIAIELPESITEGELVEVRGSLVDAATMYIDWSLLYERSANAVSAPGVVLLDIANQLKNETAPRPVRVQPMSDQEKRLGTREALIRYIETLERELNL